MRDSAPARSILYERALLAPTPSWASSSSRPALLGSPPVEGGSAAFRQREIEAPYSAWREFLLPCSSGCRSRSRAPSRSESTQERQLSTANPRGLGQADLPLTFTLHTSPSSGHGARRLPKAHRTPERQIWFHAAPVRYSPARCFSSHHHLHWRSEVGPVRPFLQVRQQETKRDAASLAPGRCPAPLALRFERVSGKGSGSQKRSAGQFFY